MSKAFATDVHLRMDTVPTIDQIKHEIERAWKDSGVMMLWGDMEDMLVIVLKSDMRAEDKLALMKEIIDAYTKRGHFQPDEYPGGIDGFGQSEYGYCEYSAIHRETPHFREPWCLNFKADPML